MIKKVYDYLLKGLGIGFIVTNIMMYLFTVNSGEEFTIEGVVLVYVVWAIASAFFGLVSIIYEVSDLPMVYKMLIHFTSIALVAFTATGFMLNNIYAYEMNLMTEVFPSFIGSFLAIYLLLWTMHYFMEKAKLARLNEKFN